MAGYGSNANLDTWLTNHGYTLPVNAPSKDALRQRGSSFIDAVYGSEFPGVPTGGIAQDRAWPRTGASAYGADIASDQVPIVVERASYAAAYYEATNPGALAVITTPAAQVRREKIEGIETEYFAGGGSALEAATPTLLMVEGLLAPLLNGSAYVGGPFVV